MWIRRCWACTSPAAPALTFEVITRRLEDRGGGLARVNGQRPPRRRPRHAARGGRVRPHLLQHATPAGSTSTRCSPPSGSPAPIWPTRRRSPPPSARWPRKMPTYITLKDVKKRWGHGQEDVFPVCQFEKLWVDMSHLPAIETRYRRGAPAARPATQGPGPTRRLAARRLRRVCRSALRLGVRAAISHR